MNTHNLLMIGLGVVLGWLVVPYIIGMLGGGHKAA